MSEETQTPTDAGTTQAQAQADATTRTAAGAGTFTQADVDRIIGERLARADETGQKKLLEQFGLKNADELKAKLDALAKADNDRLSEAEKLQKERDKAIEDAKTEREKADERIAQANNKLRHAALKTAASDKFLDPEDVWLFVQGNKELADLLVVKEDDTVEGVADVLKRVEETKKHWLKPLAGASNERGTPANNGGRQPAKPPANDATREQFARDIKNW